MRQAVRMISVVIPVHNEARVLAAGIARLKKALDSLGTEYEVIISEDGSTDGSTGIAKKLADGSSGKIRLLASEKRLGRGISLANAIRSARGDIVVYTDADLATDLGHLGELVREIDGGMDIVTGSRLLPGSVVEGRHFVREFFSRGYNLLLRILFRTSVRDHQCGFKAFRKSAVIPLLDEVKDKHWFWDSELLIRAQRKGLKVSEIPVRWSDRKQSGVNLQTDIPYMGLAALKLRLSLR